VEIETIDLPHSLNVTIVRGRKPDAEEKKTSRQKMRKELTPE
jgi:hypothetical protein